MLRESRRPRPNARLWRDTSVLDLSGVITMSPRPTNDWMFNKMVVANKKAPSGPVTSHPLALRSWWVGLPRSQFWDAVRGEKGQRMARPTVPVSLRDGAVRLRP